MKKSVFIAFIFCLTALTVAAQKVPAFADYPSKVTVSTSKPPNLTSNKNARMYRTNLRNAAKEGVNFAGHYVIATWGCGTNCSQSGIIDARTGRVFFPKELEGIGIGFCDIDYENTEALTFKPDSRLLVLSGFKGGDLNNEKTPCGIYYFEWTGTALKQIKFVQKKRTQTP